MFAGRRENVMRFSVIVWYHFQMLFLATFFPTWEGGAGMYDFVGVSCEWATILIHFWVFHYAFIEITLILYLQVKLRNSRNCWKYTPPQSIQDVEKFVSSSEKIWRNVTFHHLLTNKGITLQWMGAVRMRVQTADKTSQYSTSNPHNLWSEKLHVWRSNSIKIFLLKTKILSIIWVHNA